LVDLVSSQCIMRSAGLAMRQQMRGAEASYACLDLAGTPIVETGAMKRDVGPIIPNAACWTCVPPPAQKSMPTCSANVCSSHSRHQSEGLGLRQWRR
jgi:hypothetical protein